MFSFISKRNYHSAPVAPRVTALFGTLERRLLVFGSGEYVRDDVPPAEAAGKLAEAMRAHGEKTPVIQLDGGQTIYGCECWFTQETFMQDLLSGTGLPVVQVDIARLRALYRSGERLTRLEQIAVDATDNG